MRRLLLIRHAKSSWAEPGLADFDRPLNGRGRQGADRIGAWLRDEGLVPDRALVSPARRTRETWERITAVTGPVPTEFVRGIYEAAPDALLSALRAAPEAATLALVGHQPGIGALARGLLAAPPATAEFAKYPTGATTLIELDAPSWPAVDWGRGRLAAFVTPKGLG